MSTDVRIRPLRKDDASALYESVRESMEQLRPWMPWCHSEYAIAEAEDWIDKQLAAFVAENAFHFAIMFGDNRFSGVCGLNGISHVNHLANLGYWVRTSFAGRG